MSYKRIIHKGKPHYGKHVIHRSQDCSSNLLSKDIICEFIIELCDKIEMVRFGDPFVERFGGGIEVGISAVQLIETSAITIHTNDGAKELYLDVYDSVGVLNSWLLSDSAWLGSKMNNIRLYGSVRLHTKDGLTVRTDSLWIDKKKKRAYTDSRVRIVSPDGDVLSGVGFESDTKFQDWKIVSNVKAIIQDIESRSKGVY